MAEYDARYLKGIEYFNECEFYEAHDVWEELWADNQGPARKFYQGLIQVAVCLHHFGNGNTRGARKLYHSCRKYLEPYGELYEGVELNKLLDQLHVCCRDIVECDDEVPVAEIVVDDIPEIHLV